MLISVVSQRPRRQYMVLQWGHVDLQEYANGSFVSNNNILGILFLNTYDHKQINKILIAAFNETFRQSSDPVYAHTPMRNGPGEFPAQRPVARSFDVFFDLLTESLMQAQIKEDIKAPRHWPLWGEFTGTGEFPAQRASDAENISISWRHHDTWFGCGVLSL